MATTRIMPLHVGKGRTFGRAISTIIDYVENPAKTDGGQLITSFACNSRLADAEFLYAKQRYIRNTGRTRGKDDVIAYHLRQAFVPDEITPEEANRLGQELARRFTKENHAYIVCTHVDRKHIHNHIIWNAVSLDCDRKFRNFWGSSKAVRKLNDTICIENGYSIVENPKEHRSKSYDQWLGDQKNPSHRELLCMAIDRAIQQKPKNFDDLLAMLRDAGYEIKLGKNPSFRGEGQKRFIRLDTLGEDYSKNMLTAILAGERKHTPRGQSAKVMSQKPNLLIDIQQKLQQGKGAGYERWAKVFNLKQMAQSMNYLQEHGLLQMDALVQKSDEAVEKYHELAKQIRTIEDRMDEISVLRGHILTYVKAREVYAAYRKAGYSKKFYAEHEADILRHKAAKKAFDELGLQKLPTIKRLQDEYARLLEEKKKALPEYRKARDEMRELLTVKANVEKVLGILKYRGQKEQNRE
ncbi:MAG: relaxase/mobilization nuclease domain-containing protein [Clostridia bacterium]|nr:relaxase/mobilization nuclease domain-containing protein [Clostridia bacterium]